MRDRSDAFQTIPGEPLGEAGFAALMLARLRLHRRRRRGILVSGACLALLVPSTAWVLLPALPVQQLGIGIADVVAALVLVAGCCAAWVMVGGGGFSHSS